MLGKVFENLILTMEQEKDLRKSTGSYYTPRTVRELYVPAEPARILFNVAR